MGRILLVAACAAVAVAAPILWNFYRTSTADRKLAEDAARYRQLADKGDANAEYELGRMYLWGRGVPKDYAQADYWYQKAAAQGSAKAEYTIGNLYYYGDGVVQSYSDALVWYRKAADQGDAMAEHALGHMNYRGNGVPQSYSEALAWYRKAAAQGNAPSEYDIGLLYDYGLGVAVDHDEAKRWYRKAVSQGDRYAQEALGLRFPPLRRWVWISDTILAVVCLFVMSGLFSPKQVLHDSNARRLAASWALAFLCITMYLFSHSEYCLFPSAWLAIAFKAATSFLSGVVVTELVIGLWPKGGTALLIFSCLLLMASTVCLFAIIRFDHRIPSAAAWRFLALAASPLGTAISAAIHIWRKPREPEKGASEPPLDTGEVPHAV
jgi:hypothetical protein